MVRSRVSGGQGAVTLGGDKGYDTKDQVAQLRERNVTPHMALKKYSAFDARTTRHAGYKMSQQKRKRVEEIFCWLKTVGMLPNAAALASPAHWVGVCLGGLRVGAFSRGCLRRSVSGLAKGQSDTEAPK